MRKCWDEEGRLWGLINPIDLGVMVLLIVAVWRLFAVYLPPTRQIQTVEVTVGLLIRNVPVHVSQSIAVGQDLFQDSTESYLGKISVKQAQPAEWIVSKNGQLVIDHAPGKFDLFLKLRRRGRIITESAHGGIFLGKLAVRIGERLQTHTLYTAVTGEVASLNIKHSTAHTSAKLRRKKE
jgi:hypothetical protein